MIEFLGERVWDLLLSSGRLTGPRMAAIAYVGRGGPSILPLGAGDVLVCDGSDASLEAGSTNPSALRTYVERGVEVWSLAGLHAKVFVYGRSRRFVVVGSANASKHSQRHLGEAAVRSDDPELVRHAEDQISEWKAGALPVDEEWLERAEGIYQRRTASPPKRQPVETPHAARLWLCTQDVRSETVPAAVRDLESAARRSLQFGFDTVLTLQLNRGDEARLRPGDVMMLAWVEQGAERPAPNKKLEPWGVVQAVSPPAGRSRRPWAVLACASTVTARPTVGAVNRALREVGPTAGWDAEEPLSPSEAAGVWSVWP